MHKFKRITLSLIIIFILSLSYQVLAWGPERDLVDWGIPSSYITFNSALNNPNLGDEREFIRIREYGSEDLLGLDSTKLEIGKEYEVLIYFHNNSDPILNNTAAGHAKNVKIYSILPEELKKGEKAQITATLSSYNASPEKVWDELDIYTEKNKIYLKFVPDSAILNNTTSTNGQKLDSDQLFNSERGALIGYTNSFKRNNPSW